MHRVKSAFKFPFQQTLIITVLLSLSGVSAGYADSAPANSIPLAENFFPELREVFDKLPQNAPKLLIAQAAIEEARGGKISSASALYPKLGSDYLLDYAWQKQTDKKGTAQFLPHGQVSLTQPIYHWGALKAEKTIGKLQELIILRKYEEALTALKQELRSLYLTIYSQKKGYAILLEKHKIAERHFKEVESKAKMGNIDPIQLEDHRTTYEESKLNIKIAESLIEQQELHFRFLSQYPHPLFQEPLNIKSLVNKLANPDTQADIHYAIKSRACQFLETELSIEQLNYTKIRSKQLPTLNFKGSLSQEVIYETKNNAAVPQFSVYGGVNIHWNIFDGFQTQGEKIASKARQRRIKFQIKSELNQIENNKLNYERTLEFCTKKINIAQSRLKIAELHLATQKQLLEDGQITPTTYLGHKVHFDDSEHHLFNLLADYLNNLSAYLSLTVN